MFSGDFQSKGAKGIEQTWLGLPTDKCKTICRFFQKEDIKLILNDYIAKN